MSRRARHLMVLVLALTLVACTLASAGPEGQLTTAVPFTLAPTLFEPADAGPCHAVHVPLRAARRAREANAGQEYDAQLGGVVERIVGWARS